MATDNRGRLKFGSARAISPTGFSVKKSAEEAFGVTQPQVKIANVDEWVA